MKRIAQLLFEARSLKSLPRSGYQFLGAGNESVAEHSYTTTFIAYVLSCMVPGVDAGKLINMCLLHDLPEARIGDLNYVQKFYIQADEEAAVDEMIQNLPFGMKIKDLIEEFNQGESREARLAHDADQLAFLIELKSLSDQGLTAPSTWMPNVCQRLLTEIGQSVAETILETPSDQWWRQKFIDREDQTK